MGPVPAPNEKFKVMSIGGSSSNTSLGVVMETTRRFEFTLAPIVPNELERSTELHPVNRDPEAGC